MTSHVFALASQIRSNAPFLVAISIPIISYLAYKLHPYVEPLWLPVKRSNRHGGELVARVLKAHGVRWVFTLIGGHIAPIVVAAKQQGIQVIDVRSECTTVFAADAVSRLSGTPGVAIVTAGPGVTNTITAMKNAQMAQSPLVLIGGAAATLLKGRGSLQDVEQIDVLRSIVKFHASIRNLREIVPTLRRAFYESTNGVPGPVFVEIPIDCLYCCGEVKAALGLGQCFRKKQLKKTNSLYKEIVVPTEFTINSNESKEEEEENMITKYMATQTEEQPIFVDVPKRVLPLFLRLYLGYQLRYLFAGAFDAEYTVSPISERARPLPTQNIRKVVDLLANAKKPCLIISSQSLLDVGNVPELVSAVEFLGVPTFLSSMARGLLGRTHPLYVKQGRTRALREADLIILAGCMVDFRLDYGRVFNRKATIVAVNRSWSDLTRNSDLFWKASVRIQRDPGEVVVAVAHDIRERMRDNYQKRVKTVFGAWVRTLKEAEAEKEAQNVQKALAPSYPRPALGIKKVKQVLNPIFLCQKIEKYMSDDAILVVDGGDFAATAAYICRPRGPLKWLDPGPFGTLGVGAGFVLGAKLVNPDAEVWLVWGDGSSGYSIAEVDTFRRFGIGCICVIGNDACWSQIEREQIPKLGDNTACMLSYCDYDQVAKGFGGQGETVWQKEQLEQEDNVFVKAKKWVKENNSPYVINAHIGTSDFREGSISV